MSGPLQPRGLQLTGPLFHCPPAFAQGNARPFHSKHTHLGLLVQTGGEGGIHTHTLNIRLQIFSTSSPKTQFFVGKQQNQQDAPSPRWQQDNRERRERTGMSMPPPEPSQPMAPGSGSMGLSQAGLPRWHQCRRWKRCGFDPWVRKIPWRRTRQPTPAFLPGESHGQRSPVGRSSQGHTESDTTAVT